MRRVVQAACFGRPQLGGDPLAALSDTFPGGSLNPKWTLYEGSGIATLTVGGGALGFQINAGGVGGSFWYQALQGDLLYQNVTGDFECGQEMFVRNGADSGPPPVTDFRLAGLAAHDPDRSTALNYVHVALGATNDVDLRAEYKSTVDSVSEPAGGTSPGYGSISWPTGAGVVWLTRIGQIFTLEVAATFAGARTLVRSIDRTTQPMPATLQVGPMVYSANPAADIRAFISEIRYATP